MLTSLVGTPFLIRWQRSQGIGQPIQEEVTSHITKAGTPTMGGIAIVAGAVLGYLVAHLRQGAVFTWGGLLCTGAIAGAGVVGLVDDWIKVKNARNLGLNKRAKTAGLLIVGLLFVIFAMQEAHVSRE